MSITGQICTCWKAPASIDPECPFEVHKYTHRVRVKQITQDHGRPITIPRPLRIGELLVIENKYPGVRRNYTHTPDTAVYPPGLENRALGDAIGWQIRQPKLRFRLAIYKRCEP